MKTAEQKNLVWDVLTFTDEVNERGERVPRTSFKRQYIRGVLAIKEAIKKQIEVLIEEGDTKKWILGSSITEQKPLAERHTDTEIELTDSMKEAFRHYLKEREELPLVSEETLTWAENV